MAKRPHPSSTSSNSVTGFIHNVSPVKRSKNNNQYFDALLQTDTSVYTKLICFDKAKHRQSTEVGSARRGLKLNTVRQVPALGDASKTDILINEKTQVEAASSFKFRRHSPVPTPTPHTESTFTSIKNVKDLAEFCKVSVYAKVIKVEPVEQQDVRGVLKPKQNILVADNTDSIKLTLWADNVNQVEESKAYRFRHMTVRNFDRQKTVSGSFGSTITLDKDITSVVNVLPSEELSLAKGEISHVNIKHSCLCAACHRAIVMESEQESMKYVRCSQCGVKQKTEKLDKSLFGTFAVETGDNVKIKLTVYNSVLKKTLAGKADTGLNDPDRLEDFLLDLKEVSVQYGTDMVVKKMHFKE